MSDAYSAEPHGEAMRYERPNLAALGAAGWLSLAATPTFGIMALLTGAFGVSSDMLCSVVQAAPSPLSGMTLMYLLMGVFHFGPWLKLISNR